MDDSLVTLNFQITFSIEDFKVKLGNSYKEYGFYSIYKSLNKSFWSMITWCTIESFFIKLFAKSFKIVR